VATGDEKKSGADSYADQIFGDRLFEGYLGGLISPPGYD